MKYVFLTIVVFALSIIQTAVLGAVEIFGVIPNLLLVSVICYSLMRGDLRSIVYGSVVGFVLDILSGKMVGMNLLMCTCVALMCACLYETLFNNNSFVAAVFVLWISALYEFLIYVFYFLFWGNTDILFALFHKILPCALYNAFSTFLIYPIMRKISLLERTDNDY